MKHRDILRDAGHLALASRLKRLADALLADAAKVHAESGQPLQQGQFALIAALDRYGSMTVNDAAAVIGISQPAATRAVAEAVKAELVSSGLSESDRRYREVALTERGRQCVQDMKQGMWPRVEAAARSLTRGLSGDFLESMGEIENRLANESMLERVRRNTLSVVPYSDDLSQQFFDINAEWIEDMFLLEPHDEEVMRNPRREIIDRGGKIFFVKQGDDDILGTCALDQADDGFIELTKMAVRSTARGKGAGEFLLRFVLEHAREIGWTEKLFLLSNKKNMAAVSLYEKLGFVHDSEIMQKFGRRYVRCDVAMRYLADSIH